MDCCLCFGSRFRRENMKNQKLKDQNCQRDQSSSPAPAKPAERAIPEATQQAPDNNAQTFSYRELATATNNFRTESIIGQGGFGAVFKGKLESTGQDVAVKMLDKTGIQGDKEFLVEVLMLSLVHHEHLVKLIGYCAEGDQRLLVYEYMPLGSVEDHLHDLKGGQQGLDWMTRMEIALGAARGLMHLHNEAKPPVIYRDLKTANILLDHGYKAKLSDFGLAKFGPTGDMSHVSTRVMGTHGYCAPEYANSGKLTMKSDIYSFGVVLLELITGRKAIFKSYMDPQRFLVNWARPFVKNDNIKHILDPKLSIKGRTLEATMKKVLEVAFLCLREEANSRPSISDVVTALDHIVEIIEKKQEKASVATGGGEDSDTTVTAVSSPKETTRMLKVNEEEVQEIEDFERKKAVAEAKIWAKSWNKF